MGTAAKSFRNWVSTRINARPQWMNFLLLVCLYMTFVYMPYDFFVKPVADDVEVWFGVRVYGWSAKASEPLHWLIYALGSYGFWRMRPWMWPWAFVYACLLTVSMFVWPIAYIGGAGGWALAIASLFFFGAFAWGLWGARKKFQIQPKSLVARYGTWAVVTGASAGIGVEFARAFAEQGMNCVLVARRRERLEDLAAMLIRDFGVEVRVVDADLTAVEGLEKVGRVVADLPVAILVNNAGFGFSGRFDKQPVERLCEMVALNCTAPIVLTHQMLPGMIKRRRGAMIVTGSVAGRQPVPFHTVYSATKAFNLMFGEGLFGELSGMGIDVLVLQPGPVATEFEGVAGEVRQDARGDEQPEDTVVTALEHLGQSPSVVSGWFNWLRANISRVLPRSFVVFLAGFMMERQTPRSMR
ncbi:MAG: short-subunit dehydrogenase [Hyphomicrobiaceae bacterium]|jgi:short-subunit dehydrogenase